MRVNEYPIQDVMKHLGIKQQGGRFEHQCDETLELKGIPNAYFYSNNTFYCPLCFKFGNNKTLIEDTKKFKTEREVNHWALQYFNEYEISPLLSVNTGDFITQLGKITAHSMSALSGSPKTQEWLKAKYGFLNEDVMSFQLGLLTDTVLHNTSDEIVKLYNLKDAVGSVTLPIIHNGDVVAIKLFPTRHDSTMPTSLIGDLKGFAIPCFNYTTAKQKLNEDIEKVRKNSLQEANVLLVCETELDVLALRKYCNIDTAIALPSLQNHTLEQRKQIVELGSLANDTIICFNSIAKSKESAEHLAQNLLNLGSDFKVMSLPKDMDTISEGLQNAINSDTFIEEVRNKLYYGYSFLSEYIEEQRGNLTVDSVINRICEWIARLPSSSTKLYTTQLSNIPKNSKFFVDKAFRSRYLVEEKVANSRIIQMRRNFGRNEESDIVLSDDNNEGVTRFFMQDYWYDIEEQNLKAQKTIYTKVKQVRRDGTEEQVCSVRVPVTVRASATNAGAMSYSFFPIEPNYLDEYEKGFLAPYDLAGSAPQWQLDGNSPYTFRSFLEEKGNVSVDALKLFEDIRGVLNDYYYFKDLNYADLLTAFVMMTYVYMLVDSVPYLHIKGSAGSGKSQLVDLLQQMTFNSEKLVNANSTHIYRIVHSKRCTLFMNEEEHLNNSQNLRNTDILPILKDSYSKTGGEVPRFDDIKGSNYKVTRFNAYCPKVFSGTKPVEKILATRAIVIETTKVPPEKLKGIKDYSLNKIYLESHFQDIRNRLMIWSLTQYHTYFNNYQSGKQELRDEKIGNRDLDVWSPIYASFGTVGLEERGMAIINEISGRSAEKAKLDKENSDFAEISQLLYDLVYEFKMTKGNKPPAGTSGLNKNYLGFFFAQDKCWMTKSLFEKNFPAVLKERCSTNKYAGNVYYTNQRPLWTNIGYIINRKYHSDVPDTGYLRNRSTYQIDPISFDRVINDYHINISDDKKMFSDLCR
jgi:hypothetical protein